MIIQNKKINRMLWFFSFFLIFTIFYISFSSNAYYTDVHKYFENSRQADAWGGYGYQVISEDFIVDGCGNGTMLHTITGLCWQKEMLSSGQIKWSNSTTDSQPIWDNTAKNYSYPSGKGNYPAFAYCDDLTVGNQSDWRLPSMLELSSLLDKLGVSSSCTILSSLGFLNCSTSYYWSSSESSTSAYRVRFLNGDGSSDTKTAFASNYVVCVRSDY